MDPINQFVAVFKMMDKDCAFTDMDETIQDIIVSRPIHPKSRKKLINQEAEPDWNKASDNTGTHEMAQVQLQFVWKEESVHEVGSLKKYKIPLVYTYRATTIL